MPSIWILVFVLSILTYKSLVNSRPHALKTANATISSSNNITNETSSIKTIISAEISPELPSLSLAPELLKPPDHLEGVRMERDGHLNHEYRKEVLLGSKIDNNKSSNSTKKNKDEQILKDIFKKADLDQNNLLTNEELDRWIANQVKDHFQQAVKENFWIFSSLDKNHDGRISWQEYHVHFMMEQGFDEKYAKKHTENHKNLNRKVKEKILLDKAAWSEAANSDPDALNIDEFLTFRHPEHSHVTLLNMVNDILNSLDADGDEVLSEEEFANKTPDESKDAHPDWREDRIREFRDVIDMNRDGIVTRQELLMYNDPENPVLSKKAARDLIRIADANNDGFLSLDEILSKKTIFLGSKMVDTAKSFHDEF